MIETSRIGLNARYFEETATNVKVAVGVIKNGTAQIRVILNSTIKSTMQMVAKTLRLIF
jgi:hypothetical protein